MIIDFNLSDIQSVLNDFYKATNVNISITDSEFNLIYINSYNSKSYCSLIQTTIKGRSLCHCSDIELLKKCKETKKPQQHICHAGLMDMVIPIIHNNEIIGYILMGQLKVDSNYKGLNVKGIKVDEKRLKEEFDKLPIVDDNRIESIKNIAIIVAKYLLLGNYIKPKQSMNLESVMKFINENLGEDLSINNISRQTYLSKSLIYSLFKKYLNMTVSEYINKQRILRAKELLGSTELTIETVSTMVGYTSSSYFSKTFKKITGVSPKQYQEE